MVIECTLVIAVRKMSESFPESIHPFRSLNEPNNMKKDLFILMNDLKI